MSMCSLLLCCWKMVFALASAFSWQNLLAFALLHFVLQGQICLLLQVSLDFLLLHSRQDVEDYTNVSPSKQVRFCLLRTLTHLAKSIHSSFFRVRPFIWPDPDAQPPAPRQNSLPQPLCPHTTVSHLSCTFVPIFAAQTSNWMPNMDWILSIINSEPGWI